MEPSRTAGIFLEIPINRHSVDAGPCSFLKYSYIQSYHLQILPHSSRSAPSMASSLLSAAQSFLHPSHHQAHPLPSLHASPTSHWRLPSSRKTALRVTAQKWEPSKVVPQADRVLIRLEELPEKSAGGVLLPKSAVKFERYLMGEVRKKRSIEDTFL
ncbi:hypothetical protein COCNU_07G004400 [Cocos nucifera]|uniref:Uncharacterized protein n=1 Tax=Cocos nucifera TaxID=13894 RepID=A0A8K0IFN5_COCNU|nr:hypothetical protein COCNU_07G004400 [Cocos nucifera]